ncbi:THO complex subunit 2 isoform X3 [Planococcus citri]|uniref:THO complex subunit 2 isoform X3 n=1 Tax=Planococcus citri TaxID=170843 RepID=UPI0031F962FA
MAQTDNLRVIETSMSQTSMSLTSIVADRVSECKRLISKVGPRNSLIGNGDHQNNLLKFLYELVRDGVAGVKKMNKDNFFNIMEQIIVMHADMPSVVLDIYNVMDTETCNDPQSTARSNLSSIVKYTEKMVSDRLLKERLEIDTLQEMKVLSNKNFSTKFIKIKTKLYYKQKKYNLFREECEGYAKLITELNQRSNTHNLSYTMDVIKSLIGCFNLDPNRVLDVILDSFESHIDESEFYLPLLKEYMPQSKTLSDVLGFKFVYYYDSCITTPKSLYIITAFLLQNKAILIEDVYGWLQPDDNYIHSEWEKKINEARQRFKENSTIVVSTKEKESEEAVALDDETMNKNDNNQKFGLLEALLRVGEWNIFHKICNKLPTTFIVSQYPIAYNLCQLMHLLIDPLYRKYYEAKHNLTNTTPKTISNPLAPKQVTTFLELKNDIFPMLYTIGSYLSYDPELVYKIMRLLKLALIQAGVTEQGPPPTEDSLYFEILTVLDLTILPTLSALKVNCCVADEIWDILKLYPYNYRYTLYSRWKNETTHKYPEILMHNCEALKKIKEIMKKITKETTKLAGRQIGKLTHCLPGHILEYILNQIMMFDNLIMLVVESLKYLTGLSYDVLAYCIIEVLMQPNRVNSKQHNGMTAVWLVNLSVFCGSIYKKYNIELVGILQYVCNQMKVYKSFDLLILKEIIQKMSGIEFNEDMTNEQLSAFSGGEILKSEGGYFTHIRNTKKSSFRLKDALMENDLAVSLCLLIGQQRDCIVYKESAIVKLAGSLYDQCQDTLVQYGTYLNGALSTDDYVTRLPPIESLLTEYHLRTDVAFFLSRPKINFSIQAKFDEYRKTDSNSKKWTDNIKSEKYYEAVNEIVSPVIDSIRPLYPAKVWDDMSPKFIILFWSLTLYDLEVPWQSYQREIKKLRSTNTDLQNSTEMTSIKIKKEKEKNTNLIDKLSEEMKKQQEHIQKVKHRLEQEKPSWFLSRNVKTAKNETITQFLQHCVFPRCIFTMVDAMYCAKFIHVLHSLKTPNFSTLLCYDRLFCDIVYSVTLCTENEARRYGGFLCAVLETVMRWHADKDTFELECATFPGFVTKFRVSNQYSEANDHVGYENYRHVCHKWHYKITKALVVCLESKDYIQIRNALIILIKILPHFPTLMKLAQIIEKKVEKIIEDEKTESRGLATLAVSYNGLLKAKSPQLMREQDFHLVSALKLANENVQQKAAAKLNGNVSSQVSSNQSNKAEQPVQSGSNSSSMTNAISVVVSKETGRDDSDKSKDQSKYVSLSSQDSEKLKIIDLVQEDRNEGRNSSYERSSRDDYYDREKSSKDEKRDVDKKPKEKKSKEEKLIYEDRREEYRSKEESLIKSSSYRGGSNNSYQEYSSPRDDVIAQLKIIESYDRGEPKRRKTAGVSSAKSSKIKSASNSPDTYSPPDKKEKRSKSKRATRSSSVVIDLEQPPVKEKKREGGSRKRLRTEEEEILLEKKKKAEDKASRSSHQNGDDLDTMYLEKHHHHSSATYSKGHDRKTRDKHYYKNDDL